LPHAIGAAIFAPVMPADPGIRPKVEKPGYECGRFAIILRATARPRANMRILQGFFMDGLELRRKRAIYRALHRGTKELDLILGRYAEARVPDMDDAQLASFETVLAAQDPDVDLWIRRGEAPGELAGIVAQIRDFYKL